MEAFKLAKESILKHIPEGSSLRTPKVLIICGSGLGGISEIIHGDKIKISYEDIPGFQKSTVPGHAGYLLFGLIGNNNIPVCCMVGRLHFYEGYEFKETTFPIRVLSLMKCEYLFVTNAAGGVNSNYKPGDLMIINDHINFPGFAGYHPLRGKNFEEFGPRFLPLSDCYDLELRLKFVKQIKKLNIKRSIYEGCYLFASGPTFESRAEVRMIRFIGGDAVGMSTVPEVIVARHCGMKVFGLSLITNSGVGELPESALEIIKNEELKYKDEKEGMASHAEVLENANLASNDVKSLIEATINEL